MMWFLSMALQEVVSNQQNLNVISVYANAYQIQQKLGHVLFLFNNDLKCNLLPFH